MTDSRSDFDLIVLGLGPGGEEVAETAARAGRRVLGIDPALVGGECPYFGCIPSKMILRAAETLAESRRVDVLAGHASATPDFTPVADRIRDEATDDWDDRVAVERFEGLGGTFVRGAGRLAGRDDDGRLRVTVGDRTFRAADVVLATGTAPALPPVQNLAGLYGSGGDLDGPVWTNREAVRARTVPPSLVVLGGGAIGCELAQGFARFGARVSVVEAAPRLLAPEEPEASRTIADVFAREGIAVRTGVQVHSVTADGADVRLDLGGDELTAAKLLVAAGRRPNLADIGLDAVGLDPRARALEVDERMRVLDAGGQPVDGVHAVGDITGRGAFTHVAVWQARVLARHLLGPDDGQDFGGYHGLAWVTFTDPEVGRVGRSEAQARDAGLAVQVGQAPIPANSRGWIHGPGNDGFVKLVADRDAGVLVGATVVAPNGGEILGLLTVAVHARVPIPTLATMHYAFPTMHRAVLEALRTIGN